MRRTAQDDAVARWSKFGYGINMRAVSNSCAAFVWLCICFVQMDKEQGHWEWET